MTTQALLATLQHHIGAASGITVKQLAALLGISPRRVRRLVSEAREDGIAICAHPQTGYFIAATAEELDLYFLKFLEARALHGLRLISRVRRIAWPDYIGQLKLTT